MKKVSKAILIAFAAVLALVGLGLFGANLYLQSPGTQARIQEELSKALRVPLTITNTSVTPWGDLRISGITVPNEGANFLEAASFRAHYRWLALLRGRLEISEMSVENPKMLWRQNAEGKWKLPRREKAVALTQENPPAEAKAEPAPTAAEPRAAAPEPKPKKEKKERGFNVVIEQFHVRDGSLELVDKEGRRMAVFSEVNLAYTLLTAERMEGTATIGRIVWADALTLEKVRSPFHYTKEEVVLPELTATMGGGMLQGHYRSQKVESKTPFEAALRFDDVALDQLVVQSGGTTGQAAGRLAGNLELHGDAGKPERAEGTGHLELHDGELRQLEFFQTIGQIFAIRELADFRLKDAHADFRVSGEKIHVDELLLPAANLQLSGKGTVRFDQKVALDAQLALDEALVKQIPPILRDSFGTGDAGRRTINFAITGTTSKLKTDLFTNLIGKKINAQYEDLLSGIFGGKKKDDDLKKKEEEERKKAEKEKAKELRNKKKAEKAAGVSASAAASTPAPQP